MTLSRKSQLGAGLRSAVVPGWGQLYSDHPAVGASFFGATVLAGAGFELSRLRYEDRQDDVVSAEARLNASTTPAEASAALVALRAAQTERDDALRTRRIAGGVLAGVWAISFIETLAAFPTISEKPVSLQLGPAGAGARHPLRAALCVRF
jgi:hypothetical protein